MLNWDASKITAVIAVAAIVSPILTAVVNNVFQLIDKYMNNRESRYQQEVKYKRTIIEDYLRYASAVIASASYKDKYCEAYGLALIYVPDEICQSMMEIDELICNDGKDVAEPLLRELVPKLRSHIDKL